MKKALNIIIIIAIIFCALWVKDKFFPSVQTKVVTETKTDTIYRDTVIYKQAKIPDPVIIHKVDTVKLPPDTIIKKEYIDLYKKYHSILFYKDTLQVDKYSKMIINDSVSQNKIQSRNWKFKDNRPRVYNSEIITITKNTSQFFVGSDFGMRTIQPSVIYKSKNNIQYKIGYNLQDKNKGLRVGIYTSFSNIKNLIVK